MYKKLGTKIVRECDSCQGKGTIRFVNSRIGATMACVQCQGIGWYRLNIQEWAEILEKIN